MLFFAVVRRSQYHFNGVRFEGKESTRVTKQKSRSTFVKRLRSP